MRNNDYPNHTRTLSSGAKKVLDGRFRLLTQMLKWGERQLGGVSMDYAYHLRDVAPSRLWRFSLIKTVEGGRKHTPVDVYHAAGMAAAMVEDCGPCVQITT